MKPGWKYLLLSILAWFIVDFTTTKAIADPGAYYSTYMPLLLVFYFGYPLAFVFLRYKCRLGNRGLLVSMLIGIVLVEIVLSHNLLLYTFPVMLLAIPLSLVYYAMVTFIPLWIAEKRLKDHRILLPVILVAYVLGVLLNVATHTR